MANDTTLNPGTLGDEIKTIDPAAADFSSDGKVPVSLLMFGSAPGSLAVVNDGNPLPIDDAGGSITVDGPLTDGQLRATAVPVSLGSSPLPSGAATEAKQDTGNASLSVIDDWDESDRAKVNPIVGQAGVAAGAGAVGATVQRVTLASDDPAVAALQTLDNIVAGNEAQVDVVTLPALPAGDNNIGNVDIVTLPAVTLNALPAGTNNIGDVDILSIAAGDNNIGNVDVVSLPALPAGTNNIGDVDVLTLPALPAGTNNIGDVDVLTLPTRTLKLARGTTANLIVTGSAPGNATLSAGSRSALSAEYDNSTNLFPFGQMVLTCTFGTAPTANRRLAIYLIPAHDGTNYADGSDTIAPSANTLLGWAYVRNVNTSQKLSIIGASPDGRLHLPPSKFKVLLLNDTDQQISASWTLDLFPGYWSAT